MGYPHLVYIDPKVQLPLPKQDVKKHPKSHKTSQTGHYVSTFLSYLNTPNVSFTIAIRLSKRLTADLSSILQGNTLQSKAG